MIYPVPLLRHPSRETLPRSDRTLTSEAVLPAGSGLLAPEMMKSPKSEYITRHSDATDTRSSRTLAAMRRLATVVLVAAALAGACHRAAPLTAPAPKGLDAVGPDSFTVRFVTTRGAFDLKVHRDWSPHGSDRLYWLF